MLDVKIKTYPTHAASLPVAMIPNCAATRHAHFVLDGSGPVYLDPPSLDLWPDVTWAPDANKSKRVDLNALTKAEVASWNAKIEMECFMAIAEEMGEALKTTAWSVNIKERLDFSCAIFDANGVKWNIKFDEEVHSEVASSRIVWACGYMVEESYFIASGKVNGVTGLSRAKKFVGADGSFSNGMFEKRPENIARRAINWDWDANPFKGTKELSGLAILNTMLNNWDAKPTNNNVLGMFDDGGKIWDWYLVADWGGSFGKMGGFTSHTKWDLDDYNKQAFLDGASGGQVKLHYSGKMGSSLKTIPLEHARWFAGIIGQLTDNQLRDAFKAAGATPAEIDGFSRRLRQKISELKSVAGR